jgi:hypothetical protein
MSQFKKYLEIIQEMYDHYEKPDAAGNIRKFQKSVPAADIANDIGKILKSGTGAGAKMSVMKKLEEAEKKYLLYELEMDDELKQKIFKLFNFNSEQKTLENLIKEKKGMD